MPKELIFLSFDLGLQGDYEGMYAWLDSWDARECGDNLAAVRYEYKGRLIENLKKDLNEAMNIDNKTRIYLIRSVSGRMQGGFIFGARKRAQWIGYGPMEGEEEEDVS